MVAVLKDRTCKEKFGWIILIMRFIKELLKSGVEIYACVEALTKQKLAYNSVHSEVALARVSPTVMVNCQLQNYAYVPFN